MSKLRIGVGLGLVVGFAALRDCHEGGDDESQLRPVFVDPSPEENDGGFENHETPDYSIDARKGDSGLVEEISNENMRMIMVNIMNLGVDGFVELFDGQLDASHLANFNYCLQVAEVDHDKHDEFVMARNREEFEPLNRCTQEVFERCALNCESNDDGKLTEDCLAILGDCIETDEECENLRPTKITKELFSFGDFFRSCIEDKNIEAFDREEALRGLMALGREMVIDDSLSCDVLTEREEWMRRVLIELVKFFSGGEGEINYIDLFQIRLGVLQGLKMELDMQFDQALDLREDCDSEFMKVRLDFISRAKDAVKQIEDLAL